MLSLRSLKDNVESHIAKSDTTEDKDSASVLAPSAHAIVHTLSREQHSELTAIT